MIFDDYMLLMLGNLYKYQIYFNQEHNSLNCFYYISYQRNYFIQGCLIDKVTVANVDSVELDLLIAIKEF